MESVKARRFMQWNSRIWKCILSHDAFVCNTNPTLPCWILLFLICLKSSFAGCVCWSPMTGYVEVPVQTSTALVPSLDVTSSEQDLGAFCSLVIHILQTPHISFWILQYAFGLKSTWNMHWREHSSEYTVSLTGPRDCFSKNSNNLGTGIPIQLCYIFIVFHSTTSFLITSCSVLTTELH